MMPRTFVDAEKLKGSMVGNMFEKGMQYGLLEIRDDESLVVVRMTRKQAKALLLVLTRMEEELRNDQEAARNASEAQGADEEGGTSS